MIDEKVVALAIAREMHKGGDFSMDGDSAYEARPAEFLALARAAIAALSPGSTGSAEGWVLVPREPTDEMLAACDESKPENAKTDAQRRLATRLRDDGRRMRREDWRAMLSALPAPPSAMIDAAGGR